MAVMVNQLSCFLKCCFTFMGKNKINGIQKPTTLKKTKKQTKDINTKVKISFTYKRRQDVLQMLYDCNIHSGPVGSLILFSIFKTLLASSIHTSHAIHFLCNLF